MFSPTAALAWANSQSRWTKLSCLNFVYTAYYRGQPSGNAKAGKPHMNYAIDAWNLSTEKVTDGSEPPVGALMFFAGVPGDTAGDVQIYAGNHLTRRTDVGTLGRVATTDWKWMTNVIGHRYLGWTRDVLGTHMFDSNGNTPVKTADKPILEGWPDMTAQDSKNLTELLAIVKHSSLQKEAIANAQATVKAAYVRNLGRKVDPSGLATFTNYLLTGGTTAALELKLRASKEGKSFAAKKGK